MVFADLLFIFLFLTMCLVLSTAMPTNRSKNVVLLVFSLVFYAWSGPWLLILLCGMTLVCYIGARRIEAVRPQAVTDGAPAPAEGPDSSKRIMKLTLILTLVICLGTLAFFKYTSFLCGEMNRLFSWPSQIPDIILPIGISFYTFQLISYVVDVYRGQVSAQRKYHLLLLYAGLFHQCIAGPIVRYSDVCRELTDRTFKVSDFSRGVTRFAIGLGKKALLANALGAVADSLVPTTGAGLSSASAVTLFVGSLAYMLQIYLDFSAYSDMAIGMGLMSGFHYLENFRYPYMADSITDFWRRWHISLSSFFRDYVYIPLGGNRKGVPRQYLNLLIVWALTGIWHGAGWNFLLWGLYFFVILCVEKRFVDLKHPPRTPIYVLRRAATLILVFFGWILFRYSDMSVMGTVLRGLLCLNGNPFADLTAGAAILNNLFLFPVAMAACTPLVPFLHDKLIALGRTREGLRPVLRVLSVALPLVLILLSVLSLAGLNYNPFLYTQF